MANKVQLKDNLFLEFSVTSFAVMLTLALILAGFLSNAVKANTLDGLIDEAVDDVSSRLLTVLTPSDLESPMTGERYIAFDNFVRQSIVSERTARVKLWANDGTVIYSSNFEAVGDKFPDNEHFLTAMAGKNTAEIKVPNDPENEHEKYLGTLIEVYAPITFQGASGPQGVLEIYRYYLPTAQLISKMQNNVWVLIALGFVTMYGALVFIVWRGWKTIVRQKREREEAEIEKGHIQQQLILADKLASIGQMTSGIAHELNNPLSSIAGFSELILSKGVPENIKEPMEIIHSEANRSIKIAKGLLNYARKSHETTRLALNDVIEEVIRLRAYEHKINNIRVKTTFTEILPEIYGDAARLQQLFINLVVNAEQAMLESQKKGTLSVTTSFKDGFVCAEIGDDGPGIKPEDIEKLFTPFFTTKPAGKGTGLGLSICQTIVHEHHGTVRVESEPGKGTVFIIRLPVATQQ